LTSPATRGLTDRGGDREGVRLANALGELVHHAATAYGGRVVKLIGDGAMLHFASPSGAVRAGDSIVKQADERRIPPARVGIHAGDVIARDGDFFGRTVNLASRIQGRAGAREVLVSGAVEAATAGQGFAFESLGPVELKGVTTRVEVLRLVRACDHAADGRQDGSDVPRGDSVRWKS
jgi:adenylate cyclase